MRRVSRRFFVGAMISSFAVATTVFPQAAEAGSSFPGLPFNISGLSVKQAQRLISKHPKAFANLAKKVSSIYSSGGKVTSANYDSLTCVLTLYWKTKKGVARVTYESFSSHSD